MTPRCLNLCVFLFGLSLMAFPAYGQETPSVGMEYRMRMDAPIQSQNLQALPQVSPGLMQSPPGQRADFWQGTSWLGVQQYIRQLPGWAVTPATFRMVRQLLLTEAVPPAGISSDMFLIERVRLLKELGFSEEALKLGKNKTPLPTTEEDAWAMAQEHLRQGEYDTLCPQAAGFIKKYTSTNWAKLMIVCQIQAADLAGAGLGVTVLKESGTTDDPLFFELVDSIANSTPFTAPADITDFSALHEALFGLSTNDFPESLLKQMPPGRLASVARSDTIWLVTRLKAAFRASAYGLVDKDLLLKTVNEMYFKARELADAETLAQERTREEGIALLYKAMRVKKDYAEKKNLVRLILEKLNPAEKVGAGGDLVLSAMEKIVPAKGWEDIATDMATLYYSRGNNDKGKAWHTFALDAAVADKAALARLWPMALASGITSGDFPAAEAAYVSWSYGAEAVLAADMQLLVKALTEIATAPRGVTRDLPMRSLAPAAQFELADAGKEGEPGKTLLLSLAALGEGGPGQASFPRVAESVRSLRQAGLVEESRAVAIESLMLRVF